jgi:hypothetical protein
VIADQVWAEQGVSLMDLDEVNAMLNLHFDGWFGSGHPAAIPGGAHRLSHQNH